MNLLKMTDLDLSGKRVLIRQDLNVPIKNVTYQVFFIMVIEEYIKLFSSLKESREFDLFK